MAIKQMPTGSEIFFSKTAESYNKSKSISCAK